MNLKVNHQLLWALVGVAIGTSIGIATNQTALGVAFGITLGILIGNVVSKRMRSDSDEILREHVSELIKPRDWHEALQNSEDHPVLIFKHSTTCPTSARAYREFMAFVGSNASESRQRMDYHIVKVIESRALSRHIAEETAVIHQSPQVLLLEQGRVIQHTSHGKITKKRLTQWTQDPFS